MGFPSHEEGGPHVEVGVNILAILKDNYPGKVSLENFNGKSFHLPKAGTLPVGYQLLLTKYSPKGIWKSLCI